MSRSGRASNMLQNAYLLERTASIQPRTSPPKIGEYFPKFEKFSIVANSAVPCEVEWATQKDGKLFVGSTGKERTDDDGNVVHEGALSSVRWH